MVAIKDFEMPKSCLRCRKRKVLHIDGKHYQLCGLCEDGYLTESWFKDEDLTEDFISPNCPLEEIKPKTGHWIKSRDCYGNYHFTCPFCEHDIATKYADTWEDNYCSNCGAKMDEPQESEG